MIESSLNSSTASSSSQQASDQSDIPNGTILVVDDEAMVLDMTCRVLERSGWKILKATDGREGLQVFQDNAEQIQCVLLDLTMPYLSGVDLVREIRETHPATRILLMSGYSEQEATEQFAEYALSGFIQKPFTLKDLTQAVRRVISS